MRSTFNCCITGCWSSSSSTKSFLSCDHSFNTVVHVLNQVFFGSSKSSSVRDIKNTIVSFGVLTMDSSDLNIVLVSDFVELLFVFFLGKHWKFDMNRCSQGSSKISWAWGDVTEVVIMSELSFFLDSGGSNCKSRENSSNVSSLLHGDDSKLIFLVDPD